MADCPPVTGSLSEVTSSGNVTTATVTDLFIYPVKSTRGIARERVRIAATGFEWDRQWMIVDQSARFLTQRTHPHMARIVPQVSEGDLTLRHPELADLRVPCEQGGEALTVRIWDDVCVGVGQGSEADTWLTHALGEPVRLVRSQPQMRAANAQYASPTPAPIGFPDGYPVLVCNLASLADLNTRLPQPMPMERFRPNVVLEGLPAWCEFPIRQRTEPRVLILRRRFGVQHPAMGDQRLVQAARVQPNRDGVGREIPEDQVVRFVLVVMRQKRMHGRVL